MLPKLTQRLMCTASPSVGEQIAFHIEVGAPSPDRIVAVQSSIPVTTIGGIAATYLGHNFYYARVPISGAN